MLSFIIILLPFGEALRLLPIDERPSEETDFHYDPELFENLGDLDSVLAMKVAAEESDMRASSADPLPSLALFDKSIFNVTFYVYDELDWMSTKCNGINISDFYEESFPNHGIRKHSDDFWFLKAALNHPLRTKDPAQAELFVVPALLNTAAEQVVFSHKQCCLKGMCNGDFFKYTNQMLDQSPWFKRNMGKDHVVVCSHYACSHRFFKKFKNLNMCNSISFEENSHREGRCRIAKIPVGNRCDDMPKQFMVGMVARLHPERRTFRDRGKVCKWMGDISKNHQNLNVSICGNGKQCPALAQSQFGFHMRGDTWGSARPIDCILSGTVPMFTNAIQYKILPPYVPWENISALIDVSNAARLESSLKEIVPQYDALRNEMDKYAPLVDWKTPAPFEGYMSLFRQCV